MTCFGNHLDIWLEVYKVHKASPDLQVIICKSFSRCGGFSAKSNSQAIRTPISHRCGALLKPAKSSIAAIPGG